MIPPVAALGGEFSINTIGTPGQSSPGSGTHGVGAGEPALEGPAGTGPEGGFHGALTEAISSLEGTQQDAVVASQGLATGKVSDPESALVTVEDAQMAMDLASQVRNKAVEAAQSIFQTQV
jgi:flagellar hook-basal body complex protein FliE